MIDLTKKKHESDELPAVASDDGKKQVCEKAFSPETARNGDKDEPCDDGVD